MKAILVDGKYNRIKCSECGCEYSFDASDLNEDKTVSCPQCGKADKPDIKNT